MKKKYIITIAVVLAVCLVIAGCVLGVKEYKARIPELTVEYTVNAKPGDAIVIDDLVQVDVKGDYEIKYEIWAGHEWGYIDDNGVLHIQDNGKSANGTISVDVTATGSLNQSSNKSISVIIQNEINENNSYEVTYSGISLRMYNGLEDQGNGVFSGSDYNVSIHVADEANDLDELEAAVKEYVKENYSVACTPEDNYAAEDITLSSGKTVRAISFSCVKDDITEEYYALETSGGTFVKVVIFAFCEEEHRFFIADNHTWAPWYEMEQIANTVECD